MEPANITWQMHHGYTGGKACEGTKLLRRTVGLVTVVEMVTVGTPGPVMVDAWDTASSTAWPCSFSYSGCGCTLKCSEWAEDIWAIILICGTLNILCNDGNISTSQA